MKLKITRGIAILIIAIIQIVTINRGASAQIITTVAGNGFGAPSSGGYSGDGGPATDAEFFGLTGIAIDDSDNIYIADFYNNHIRKVSASTGIITNFAGSTPGYPAGGGYTGDGGPATAAQLFAPATIAVNDSGNVYFTVDGGNKMLVRKVSAATGIISTLPCKVSPHSGPGGVAVDNNGHVYITGALEQRIFRVTEATGKIDTIAGTGAGNGTYYGGFTGDGGPAKAAQLSYPNHIAVDDSGNVYFSDATNQRVRKINALTGIITTVAGNGHGAGSFYGTFSGDGGPATSASLSFPGGLHVDHDGNIYIADTYNSRIRVVNKSTGIITTVAGNGTSGFSGDGGIATAAEIYSPYDLAVDGCGNVFIADWLNSRVRKVTVTNNNATTSIKSSVQSICAGQSVTFSDSSNFKSTGWQWSFPGGTPSSSVLQNLVVIYSTPGSYDVMLSAVSRCNGAADTVKQYITVNTGFNLSASASPDSICSGSNAILTVTGGASYNWAPSTGLNMTSGNSVIADPTVTTTYTVTSGSGNCMVEKQVVVTISGSGTAGAITALRDTICQGTPGNLILTGNSSNTIQWQSSTSQGNFTNVGATDTTRYKTNPLSQTTYFRVIVGNGSCVDTSSDSFSLFVPPALVATFNYSSPGSTLTFNSDSSTGAIVTYHWDFGDGSTSTDKNPVHTYTKTDTTYYVCLTLYDGSNCSYTFCKYASITTGVSTIAGNSGWTIYPTPFNTQLIINGKELNTTIESVGLYDVLGRVMFDKTAVGKSTNPILLDVSILAKGVYFLHLKTTQNEYVQKVIKQ